MAKIKELIQMKIDSCKNDMIRTKSDVKELKEKCEDANYTIDYINDQYNKALKKFHRLEGELMAYIDCFGLLIDKSDNKEITEKYRLMTLREYINKHTSGAYIHFKFYIGPNEFNVINVEDFCKIGNEKILDEYYVENVEKDDNGAGCDQYYCEHSLDLIGKWEVEQNEK